VPPLLFAVWYSSQVLGWYAMTDRVMCVPTALVGAAISQVYTVDAARLVHTNLPGLRTLLFRTMLGLACLGALPYLVMFLYGETLFSHAFGVAWSEAGRYAHLLAAMQYAAFVVWPVIPTLNLLERQSWQCIWDIGRLALTLSAVGLAHLMDWPARVAVGAYGCALLIGYAIHPLISLLAISRRMRSKVLFVFN
jgi:O-antigen/teichoic acid export membrane protein